MSKVFWSVTMSLDGFIAGPDDWMDWVFNYIPIGQDISSMGSIVDEIIRSTGSVLSGRRSYNLGRKPGQRPEARKVLGGAWSGPVFVLTHHAPHDESDTSIEFISGSIRSAIEGARDAAAGKDVMLIGADVARQCIQEGLIDEIPIFLAPVLLGVGIRFFNWPDTPSPVRLETTGVTQSGQITILRFRVVR
jgi:dihydrofolate reductase